MHGSKGRVLFLLAAALVGCSGGRTTGSPEAGTAADASGGDDASGTADAGAVDAADATEDGSTDAGADGAGRDAEPAEAAADAAHDAPPDGVADAPPLEAGVCNALVNDATPVPETQVAAEAPTARGGTVVPGRYRLTQWQIFTGPGGASGPTGNTRKYVLDLHASTYDEVIADNGNSDERYTRTWSTQGTFFSSTQICPTQEPLGDDYTATPTTLTLSAYGVVMTFTKQ